MGYIVRLERDEQWVEVVVPAKSKEDAKRLVCDEWNAQRHEVVSVETEESRRFDRVFTGRRQVA